MILVHLFATKFLTHEKTKLRSDRIEYHLAYQRHPEGEELFNLTRTGTVISELMKSRQSDNRRFFTKTCSAFQGLSQLGFHSFISMTVNDEEFPAETSPDAVRAEKDELS